MDEQTLSYYNTHSSEVARRYEATAEGISSLFPFVFERGETVLEIGTGSGRDAARLLGLGMEVDTVEPSAGLRQQALAAHPELSGRVHDGFLPGGLPRQLREKYDGILLSAVIMHIPDAELFDTAFTLRERLAKGGKLLISMPVERSDVGSGSDRDSLGRLMIVRSAEQVKLLFERLGFELQNEWKSADSAGRDFLWITLYFRSSGASTRAIDRVESIVNADRKVATYKLALVRALCDIAMTAWASASWERQGVVGVPLQEVSERWQRYYWPLLDTDKVIPQINAEAKGGKPIAFRRDLTELIRHFRKQGGLTAFAKLQAEGGLAGVAAALDKAVVRSIGSTIVKGPVQFAGGARGEPEFAFDKDSRRILVRVDVWRELSLMGHWIRDAVILRWAEMTSRLSGANLSPGFVMDRLLQSAEPFRMDPVVKGFYGARRSKLECVWTGKPLTAAFEVDHAIPFAFWQASPIWDLFPASRVVNNEKRDRLPTSDLVGKREEAIVDCWRMLEGAFPARFKRETSSLLGRPPEANWEKPLMCAFVEAVEYTASVRGAERWEPS